MEEKVIISPLKDNYIAEIISDGSSSKFLEDKGISQCIIYNYDSLLFGDIKDVDLNFENIMEARFFNNNYEISLVRDGEEFRGTIFNDNDYNKSHIIEEERYIYCKNGSREKNENYRLMNVKKYIEYDKVGQAYVSFLKPCRLLRGDR